MIISRTPFRISFFGGGTDYPAWYSENKGSVLTTTINKYCYVTARYLPPFFDYNYRVRYYQREETKKISEIKHLSVRECLKFLKFKEPVEIQHNGDLPARIGIGSSSSFTVGLLNVLYALKGKMVTKRQLALEAIHIEQEQIKENVGSQDQIITAFGGLNKIDFYPEYTFQIKPITLHSEKMKNFHAHLMLFFTGFTRTASEVAGEQINKIPKKTKELQRMSEMAEEATDILNGSPSNINDLGKLMHEAWMIKRKLSTKITTPKVDKIYKKAREAGAIGGKLLGAGGGGCILFFVKPGKQENVKKKLKNLLYIPFEFENLGSQIVYYSHNV